MLYNSIAGEPTVRLVGPVDYMGRVEILDIYSNQWGTVCADDVQFKYGFGRTVCESLGYGGDSPYSFYQTAGSAGNYSNISLSLYDPIVNRSFYCSSSDYQHNRNLGYKHQVYWCQEFMMSLGSAPLRCNPNEELVVVCRRKLFIYIFLGYKVKELASKAKKYYKKKLSNICEHFACSNLSGLSKS